MSRRATSRNNSANRKTSGYINFLELKKSDKDEEYVGFTKNPNVSITVNGTEINGLSGYLNDPAQKFEKFVEMGKMTEQQAEEAVAKIPGYVLAECVVKVGDKYITVLDLKEGDNGEYFSFTKNPNVEILVNGVKVNGKSAYLNDPTQKFDKFVELGKMSEEDAEVAKNKIPEYVLAEAVVKLD